MQSLREIPITLGPDGLYHAKVTVGTKPNGAPDRRHRSGRTADIVREKLRALLREVDAGRTPRVGRTPTVEQWITHWLTDIAPAGAKPLAPRTIDDYWSKSRTWIFPHLGKVRLDVLEREPERLDALYTAMRRAGLAPATILKTHAILRRGLKIAVRRGRMGRNPAEMIDPPGYAEPAREALTRDESRLILAAIAGWRLVARWVLAMATGVRQGEALGLRWSDVDLDDGVIRVQWQLQRRTWRHGCAGACGRKRGANCPNRQVDMRRDEVRLSGGLVLCRPKGWRRRPRPRVVPLPKSVVALLRTHRARQAQDRLTAGDQWRDHDLLFCRVDGSPVDPRADYAAWHEALAAAKLPPARVHVLRHTTATVLLELGEDISVIQEVLGHADIRTTRGYQDVTVDLTRGAAKRLEDGLFGAEEATVTDLVTRRKRRPA